NREHRIGGFDTIASALPSLGEQQQALDAMRSYPPGTFDAERIARAIAETASANGFRPATFDEFSSALRRALSANAPVDAGSINDPMLTQLMSRFLQRHGGTWYSVQYVYPPPGGWGHQVPLELLTASQADTHVVFTGVNIVSAALRDVARRDAVRATIL